MNEQPKIETNFYEVIKPLTDELEKVLKERDELKAELITSNDSYEEVKAQLHELKAENERLKEDNAEYASTIKVVHEDQAPLWKAVEENIQLKEKVIPAKDLELSELREAVKKLKNEKKEIANTANAHIKKLEQRLHG